MHSPDEKSGANDSPPYGNDASVRDPYVLPTEPKIKKENRLVLLASRSFTYAALSANNK